MDVARTPDGSQVSIETLRTLAVIPELVCIGEVKGSESECGGHAWVCALHSQKKHPYFAGHHQRECEHSSERSNDEEGDAGHSHAQQPLPIRWRVKLEQATPSVGPDGRGQPNDDLPGTRTRRTFVDSAGIPSDAALNRSLSSILTTLTGASLPAGLEIEIGGTLRPAHEIITHASKAFRATFGGSEGIFWGQIESHRATPYGGVMLRPTDAADSVAFLLDATVLRVLGISNMDELIGRHVIGFGTYAASENLKQLPWIRILNSAHIAFLPRLPRT
jgi:hypothetical protein